MFGATRRSSRVVAVSAYPCGMNQEQRGQVEEIWAERVENTPESRNAFDRVSTVLK